MAMQRGAPARWICRGGPFDGQEEKRLQHIRHRVGDWYYRETDEVIIVDGMFYRVYEWIENTVPPTNSRSRQP
jgi:hypothetical protein